MPKIDVSSLPPKDKKRLRIWTKEHVIIEIGNAHYEVEPQPAKAVLQFQDLIQLYVDYGSQYKDKDKDKDKKAKDKKAEGIGVKEFRELVETLVGSPYPLLKPFVPDLEEEDAKAAPWGQVWHNLSVLADINGLGWGEQLLKEYVVPFVPDLLRSLLTLGAGAAKARASLGENGSPTPISTSTSSPESPTDSTQQEP